MDKKKFLYAFGVLISFLAIIISLKDLDWSSVPEAFGRAKILTLFFLIPLFYISFFIRTLRWQLLLPSSDFKSTYDATMLGFFASFVLPLRAGEFIRPWLLSKWTGTAFLTCFASIVVERVFDILALIAFLSVSISLIKLPDNLTLLLAGAKILVFLCVIISLVVLISYIKPLWIEFFVNTFSKFFLEKKFPQFSKKIKQLSQEFIVGLKVIDSASKLIKVIILSILLWLVMSINYQVVIWSFYPSASILVGMTTNSVVALAVAAPSAPGFIGTYQLGCVVALKNIFGFSQEIAVAFSVISHFSQYLLTILSGIVVLRKRGLRFSEISNLNNDSA